MRTALFLPQMERSTKKRCGTCLHFQTAPLPGQGWCRNSELRSDYERALVNRNDYRCFEMLDDYWEPAPDLDEHDGNDLANTTVFAAVGLPGVKKHHVYAVVLSLILLTSAVIFFSNNVLSTPIVSKPSKSSLTAVAREDFWLREDATRAIPSLIYIMVDSKLELIDSKAGEILDPSLPSPAKWYKLRVVGSGDIGWAYSGWVERH